MGSVEGITTLEVNYKLSTGETDGSIRCPAYEKLGGHPWSHLLEFSPYL